MLALENQRHEVNAPDVAAEIIDGEAIILDLRQGHYFSTEGCGAFVWAGIEAHATAHEIAARLAAATGTADALARDTVAGFVAELVERALIRPSDALQPEDWAWTAAITFAPPRLDVYTDMQDIMQLDPIHDVDARGWPIAPQEAIA